MLSIFPRGVLDEILNLIESVSEDFPSYFSTPLCSLFNRSLHRGIMPSSYKEANVCPVPKTGDLSMVSYLETLQ